MNIEATAGQRPRRPDHLPLPFRRKCSACGRPCGTKARPGFELREPAYVEGFPVGQWGRFEENAILCEIHPIQAVRETSITPEILFRVEGRIEPSWPPGAIVSALVVAEGSEILQEYDAGRGVAEAQVRARDFRTGLLIGRGWRWWYESGSEGSPRLIPPEEYKRRMRQPLAGLDQQRLRQSQGGP